MASAKSAIPNVRMLWSLALSAERGYVMFLGAFFLYNVYDE